MTAGDLNAISWKKGNKEWAESMELWHLNSPGNPTFKKRTSPDAMVMAPGDSLPERLLPIDMSGDKEKDLLESYPAYVSEQPILRDHVARFLTFQTSWLQRKGGLRKHNTKELSKKESGKKNKLLYEAIVTDTRAASTKDLKWELRPGS